MKTIQLFLGALLILSACENDLDQIPPNIESANSLTDMEGVLNAAYYYQLGSVTPMAVMGDFRADNALMEEEPYPAFDRFDGDLVDMEDQFFSPFYTALYKSILSANRVIESSLDVTEVGEAKFLRALSYFKLVRVFGEVSVILSAQPDIEEIPNIDLTRQPVSNVYDNVIIPDLIDAISALGVTVIDGRASKYAAQGLLGKVYMQKGDFISAENELEAVVNGAAAAGIELKADFADIFGEANEGGNSEIIFAIKRSSSITDEYGFSEFWSWSGGLDTKSLTPLDADLIAAFDAIETADGGSTDLRRAVTINEENLSSPKFPQTNGDDHDWIELRLADVILLYAEALNENGSTAEDVLNVLNPIRSRAGLNDLDHTVLNTQALVRQAIYDERRVEMAFEGQRWFDLVRTGTVDAEMGQTINSNYHVFPIPVSEVLVTNGDIVQNPGY